MRDKTAAISGNEVMPYLFIASTRNGAAWVFVAHSPAAGAPEQEAELGEICKSIAAAVSPAARGKMTDDAAVGGSADTNAAGRIM